MKKKKSTAKQNCRCILLCGQHNLLRLLVEKVFGRNHVVLCCSTSYAVLAPMGAAASVDAALPDRVDKDTAQKVLGDKFDETKFAEAADTEGTIAKDVFLAAIAAESAALVDAAQSAAASGTEPTPGAGAQTKVGQDQGGEAKPTCLWLCGDPGSGKTFLGDYLATRGWHHIDGDQGNQAKDADVQQRWGQLYQAMTLQQSGKSEEVTEQLWRPYYELLVKQFKDALGRGKNVVLSFAVLDLFGERSFLEAEIPGITFVVVEVSEGLRIERCLARGKIALEKAGTCEEEVWKQDYMADYRKRYGEEYTEERYRQMEIDGAKEQVYVKKAGNEVVINNDNFEDFSAVKALNDLVGLDWADLNPQEISDVNMKRMENLNT